MPDWEIALGFMVIAFIYASVGFGGGSSYLALLALAGLPFQEIRLTALLCNIIVVAGGTLLFVQNKQLDLRKTLPLVLAGVPAAFLGATMKISESTFYYLLGATLLVAGILLWFQPQPAADDPSPPPPGPLRDASMGAVIGGLSGMVGIGGGIFLSPILHLLRWDSARKIAATAGFFILVNSVAGIAGQMTRFPAHLNGPRIALLCGAVFIGGQAGARLSLARFSLVHIRRLTAVLVFAAGIEVLWKHWNG